MCPLHGNQYTFMIFGSVLPTVRNVSNESYRENRKIRWMFNNAFPENRAVGETMWKNMVEPDRPQVTIYYGACAFNAG